MAKRADRRVLNFNLYTVDEADVGDLHPLEIDQLSVEEQNFIEIVQEELDKFHENHLDGRTITIRGDRLKAKLGAKMRQQPAAQRQSRQAVKRLSNEPLVIFKPL
jgi:hypothetical protein